VIRIKFFIVLTLVILSYFVRNVYSLFTILKKIRFSNIKSNF